jgi:hypothetical protein
MDPGGNARVFGCPRLLGGSHFVEPRVGVGERVPCEGIGAVHDVVVLLRESGVEGREDLLLQTAVAAGVGIPCPSRQGVAVGGPLARRIEQSDRLAEVPASSARAVSAASISSAL